MTQFELKILDLIQNIRFPLLDDFMVFVTKLGDAGWLWIILTGILLVFKKTRKIGLMCALALIIGAVVTNVTLKPLIARVRPYTYNQIPILIEPPKDFSFPSGHTTASFAFAFAWLRYAPKKWYTVVLILVATLVSFTRLYLYVHFPSDILVAILIGFLASWISYGIIEKYKNLLKL
ncbi:MAG: phosphatase PAP2 family protein [Clostridia bacterium]|nr:phosphatase PAP2 family protein [Clostridia bacterium]